MIQEELGLEWERPTWLSGVALTRISTSSPALLRPFPTGGGCTNSVKLFNFLLGAHVAPFGHPNGVGPQRHHHVQSFSTDADQWISRPSVDVFSGKDFRVATEGSHGGDEIARV
jgi:hypothetical protein